MPTAYGAEFRQDVIDVARKGEAPLAQIAKDFGLSVTTLKRWIAIAERKETGAGPAAAESAEMRELKKRNRLLEQENEILRRAAAYLAYFRASGTEARTVNGSILAVPEGPGQDRRRLQRGIQTDADALYTWRGRPGWNKRLYMRTALAQVRVTRPRECENWNRAPAGVLPARSPRIRP